MLDLHDVGTGVGEQLRAVGARDLGAEIEHADVTEWELRHLATVSGATYDRHMPAAGAIVVTGAARGMGLTAAHRLYTSDAPMVLVDLNEDGIRAVARRAR